MTEGEEEEGNIVWHYPVGIALAISYFVEGSLALLTLGLGVSIGLSLWLTNFDSSDSETGSENKED